MRLAFIHIGLTSANNISTSEHQMNAFEQITSYLRALYRNESLQFIVISRKKIVLTPQKTQCLHYEDQLLRLRREIIAVRCQKLRKHTKTPPSTGCGSFSAGDRKIVVWCRFNAGSYRDGNVQPPLKQTAPRLAKKLICFYVKRTKFPSKPSRCTVRRLCNVILPSTFRSSK
jgi:hypothetical protein